jgi:hypothetical protein
MTSFKKNWIKRLFGNNGKKYNNYFNSNNYNTIQPLISTTHNVENLQNVENDLSQKAIEIQEFFGYKLSINEIIQLLQNNQDIQVVINTYYDNLS